MQYVRSITYRLADHEPVTRHFLTHRNAEGFLSTLPERDGVLIRDVHYE